MSNDRFTPFLSWTYPADILAERVGIIEELLHFVLEGAYSSYERKQHEKAETFSNAVRAHMLPAYQPLMKKVPASWAKGAAERAGETVAGIIDAFKEAKRCTMYGDLLGCPPFRDENIVKHFCIAFSTEVQEVWKDASPSVKGAYLKALENLYNAETRMLSMNAIVQMLRPDEYKQINLEGYQEILDVLRVSRAQFMRNVAMFGGLLGGRHAANVAQLLAKDACHKTNENDIQYSVIHFLMGDGRCPGSWSSDTEDKLRADIKKHFNKLGE